METRTIIVAALALTLAAGTASAQASRITKKGQPAQAPAQPPTPPPATGNSGQNSGGNSQGQTGGPSGGQTGGQSSGAQVAPKGVLALSTNNAQQQIEFVIGPNAGDVQVIGINGGSSRRFRGVNAITLNTGSNLDVVTFQILTAQPPTIAVNTNAGDSDVKFIYDVQGSVASTRVDVAGGSGNDKVAFEARSTTQVFSAIWNARLGPGDNETIAKVEHPIAGGSTNVAVSTDSGPGQDKLVYEIISAAGTQDLRVAGNMGPGNDQASIKYDGLIASATASTFGLDLGQGQDNAEALFTSRGGAVRLAGNVAGGPGDDNIKFLVEGNGSATANFSGDQGNDYLDIELKGDLSGGTTQNGGPGNDFLKLVVIGPRRFNPLLDGGPGIDAAIGFGTIINVEQIDRQ